MSDAEFDLGRLLRLEGAIKAAAGVGEVDGTAAPGLTASYMRLRGQVAELVKDSGLADEFEGTFPGIEIEKTPRGGPMKIQEVIQSGKFPAQHARSLLQQLAGWIGGIAKRATIDRQMELNAEAYAKEARKGPVGFHPGDE